MPGGWSDIWGEARMANGDLREGMVSKDDDGEKVVGRFGADSRSILVVTEWKLACRPAPPLVGVVYSECIMSSLR